MKWLEKYLPQSGSYYYPSFTFVDKINIPKVINNIYYDDNELLKFKLDQKGKLSIIELSETPFIDYSYFNWDYKGDDSKYKWYYINPSGNSLYKLYPSGDIIPFNIPYNDTVAWNIISLFIREESNTGYFKRDTFCRIDSLNPSGWVIPNEFYPTLEEDINDAYYRMGNIKKPKFNKLINYQYKPIKLFVGSERELTSDVINGKDKTYYKENKIPVLDSNKINSLNSLQYYFDGNNLITNYDFADENVRRNVHVMYNYLPEKLKLVAKIYTGKKGQSEYTPIIDNYIMKISTQRINR